MCPGGWCNVLSGTCTWTGQTFASMGLTEGTYVWNTATTTAEITLNIGSGSSVETPSMGTFGIGLVLAALSALLIRRKRQK